MIRTYLYGLTTGATAALVAHDPSSWFWWGFLVTGLVIDVVHLKGES